MQASIFQLEPYSEDHNGKYTATGLACSCLEKRLYVCSYQTGDFYITCICLYIPFDIFVISYSSYLPGIFTRYNV